MPARCVPSFFALSLALLFAFPAFDVPAQTAAPDGVVEAGAAVLDAMRAGDLAAIEARFDERMRQALPHDKLVATTAQIEGQIGRLQDCAAPATASRRWNAAATSQ